MLGFNKAGYLVKVVKLLTSVAKDERIGKARVEGSIQSSLRKKQYPVSLIVDYDYIIVQTVDTNEKNL